MISVACNNGEFTKSCIAAKATTMKGTGAIVYLGSYISQPWTPPQYGQKEMVRLMANNLCLSVGAIVYNGTSAILDKSTSGEYLETFLTWIYFGDPSVQMFNDKPTKVTMTSDEKIPLGQSDFKVSLSTSVNGRIGFYGEKNGFIASQMLDKKSDSNVPVKVPADETKVTVTVTGQNILPIIKELAVGQTGIVNSTALAGVMQLKQFNNSLSVKIPTNSKHTIVVRNIQGKIISSLNVSSANVWYNMDIASTGMHLVTVSGNGKTITQKYMILK